MFPTPTFLAIGHLTRDMQRDGSFSLGGTTAFAALTADRLGLAAGIVTSAEQSFIAEVSSSLSSLLLHVHPSQATTTFANSYDAGSRTQYLLARAPVLVLADVPDAWRNAPIVLLGPVDQEISPDLVALFPRRAGALVAATPQGWLRGWGADGRVRPVAWETADQILPLLDVLILSYDDLLPFGLGDPEAASTLLRAWSTHVPMLVATNGRHGATLFHQGRTQHFSAYPAHEVDPTGAGDVFAAALLVHLARYNRPDLAVDFANWVASFSVEQHGIGGIPTRAMVEKRLRR